MLPWHAQPKETVGKIIGAVSLPFFFRSFTQDCMYQARQQHSFLSRYSHGWPIEEFLKTYLKNKRAYGRKRGYLMGNTNKMDDVDDVDDGGGDDDDDNGGDDVEEEIMDAEEQYKGKGKGKEMEEEEWDRGNGWGKEGA